MRKLDVQSNIHEMFHLRDPFCFLQLPLGSSSLTFSHICFPNWESGFNFCHVSAVDSHFPASSGFCHPPNWCPVCHLTLPCENLVSKFWMCGLLSPSFPLNLSEWNFGQLRGAEPIILFNAVVIVPDSREAASLFGNYKCGRERESGPQGQHRWQGDVSSQLLKMCTFTGWRCTAGL